jgi:hypothetical protein
MRHVEQAMMNDRPVLVTMGWDQPLQGYFMTIEPVEGDNPDANEETGLIYSNLDDDAIPSPGMTRTIDHYKQKLRDLKVVMSPDFFGTVLAVCD